MNFRIGDEVIAYGKSYGIVTWVDENDIEVKTKLNKHFRVSKNNVLKSPHQELLDLGWKEIKHYETHIRYQLNFQFELLIERKGKGYEILEYTEVKHIVDLKLSRILTRYLEELE